MTRIQNLIEKKTKDKTNYKQHNMANLSLAQQ